MIADPRPTGSTTLSEEQKYKIYKWKPPELNSVDFQLSSKANEIDRKFLGLKWITPDYKINPNTEIELVKDIKFHLKNDDRKIMLLTNYSFFFSNFR